MKNSKPTPAYYAIIPAPVRYDNTLTDKAKILYGTITAYCDKKGYCWATNKDFAEQYKCTIQYIIKLIFTDIALLTINIFPKYAK